MTDLPDSPRRPHLGVGVVVGLLSLFAAAGMAPAAAGDGHPVFATVTSPDVGVLPRDQLAILATDTFTVSTAASVIIDQRYFNRPGNEQGGLARQTEASSVGAGTYVVPEAPPGYRPVCCEHVRFDLEQFGDLLHADDGSLVQGAGIFPFVTTGRHLVCYQR
jgi:hypothetical protein